MHTHVGYSNEWNLKLKVYPVAFVGARIESSRASSSTICVAGVQLGMFCGKPGGAVPLPLLVHEMALHAPG